MVVREGGAPGTRMHTCLSNVHTHMPPVMHIHPAHTEQVTMCVHACVCVTVCVRLCALEGELLRQGARKSHKGCPSL